MDEKREVPRTAGDETLGEKARRLYRELRSLLREGLQRRAGGRSLRRTLQVSLPIQLTPFLEGSEPGAPPEEDAFARWLLERIDRAVEDEIGRDEPFPPGRVRCFWCGSFDCEHASPAGARSIFGGYGPTGLPLWPELATAALERRDPRIDDLYRDPPIPLVILQNGRELVKERLPVYGKHSGQYRILGQVALGYLSLPVGPGPERTAAALTFQAVEVDRGRRRIHLNILGRLPDGTDLWRVLEEERDSRLADAVRAVRARLNELGLRRDRRKEPRGPLVMASLGRLARNLERIFRQNVRRTKHSQDRHRDRERPTAAAFRDAAVARAEEIYRDVAESTWVVLGPRSRVHFFNDSGQHITSVVYPGETVQRRLAQGKWRSAPPETVRGFREALERMEGAAEK